jgi:electron transfer flavoprotein alpha subunit
MTTLLLAEHDGTHLSPDTARSVSALAGLGDIHLLVAGNAVGDIAAAASRLTGVGKVLHSDGASLAYHLAEPLTALITSLAGNYEVIAAAASSTGKSTMPRVAALLDVMQVSDVIAIDGPRTFKRPIYAGNAIQTVETTDSKIVLTVRTPLFEPAPEAGSAPSSRLRRQNGVAEPDTSKHRRPSAIGPNWVPPALSYRAAVPSVARTSSTRFSVPLAEKLNAALGASRAAVDAGYAANDLQVGQTGKVVAPDLYIACGISGAIQHVAGIKAAKVIVAINSDPNAPIFALADYGLVGDIFTLVPELTAKL